MSTKTSIKRIALVAVSALGFGLLSVVPAKAATIAMAYSMTVSGTANDPTTAVAAGTEVTATLVATGTGTSATNAPTIAASFKLLDPNGAEVTTGVVCTAVADNGHVTSSAVAAGTCNVSYVLAVGANKTGNIATLKFTPTMGGIYTITATQAAVTTATPDTFSAVTAGTVVTATTVNGMHISGIRVSQGTTRGLTGAARVGNQAQVYVLLPAQTASKTYKFVSSGVGAIVGATPVNGSNANISGVATDFSQGTIMTSQADTDLTSQLLTLTSTAAGIQTITVTTIDGTTGLSTALYTTTVTWAAAPTLAPTSSLVRINAVATAADAQLVTTAGAAWDTTSDSLGVWGAQRGTAAATNRIAKIQVILLNSNGTAATQGNTITASVSGSGLVDVSNSGAAANGTARSDSYTMTVGSENVAWVHINTDGTAGEGTITISVTDAVTGATTTLGTRKVFSWGSVAKLEVSTSTYSIGRAGFTTGAAASARTAATSVGSSTAAATVVVQGDGTQTTTPAFVVKATDAGGNLVNLPDNGVPAVVSSDVSVATGGTCALDNGTDAVSSGDGYGYYNCSFSIAPNATSGSKATLTIRVLDPARAAGTTSYLTATYEVSVGGSPVTGAETLSFDKATYAPGEAMVITRTAVDASGNPVFDGATAPAVSFSKGITGSIAASTYVGGKRATSATAPTVFAPAVSGQFEAYMTANSLARVSAKATVGDDAATAAAAAAADAAAEAIDAANAATDAANLAAEAADAATVAAEEARDAADAATAAVEELATQVATLMAALKAQITTLANTVAKIAKKVKA